MRIALKRLRNSFVWDWLTISLILWIGLTVSQLVSYTYKSFTFKESLTNEHGTVVSFSERFVAYNYDQLIWLTILIYIFLAEANYKYFFNRKNTWLFIISSYSCGILFQLYASVSDYLRYGLFYGILQTLIIGAAFGITFFLYALIRNYQYKKLQAANIKSEKAQAELATLKAQVNPHFFFNTLNTLYGTALEENASRTANSIEQLAGIMRYTINEAQHDYTNLKDELDFIEDYLHLQKLRLPERANIQVQTEIKYDGKPAKIAPMLLMPFIENAFKYGISIDKACSLNILLQVQNSDLILIAENKILKDRAKPDGLGTGIANTKQRLQLLYPTQHKLTITANDTYKVELHLHLG